MACAYLKTSAVRKLIKSQGKRCKKDFLVALDRQVEEKVTLCCERGPKTLGALTVELTK